jgi:uncharacterized protein YggE
VTRELHIAARQVRSTRISVNPEYNWNDTQGARRLIAYNVQRQLIIELDDIEQLGALLEQSVTAGANLVNEPQLGSSRRAELEREALARAVADARQNAATIATALGASVGAPRQVTSGAAAPPPGPMPVAFAAMAKSAGAEAPASYQSGELTFSASVTASFDLQPGAERR